MGAVMGHELSHGFDDQGRKFSPEGKLEPWWEPEASKRFEEQASCVADLYSSYEIEPGIAVNGLLTLGENIADLGGVKQAYRAYQSRESEQGSASEPFVEGLTNDQLFFVAYGQVWCGLATPEQARVLIATDSHSPAQFRVQGPLSNNLALAEVFGCSAESPMVAENRCEVW
jgi:predicted metalloendopeptidase